MTSLIKTAVRVLIVLTFAVCVIGETFLTGAHAAQVNTVVPIKWARQPGVTRYRLQIARDERFTDVLFDGRVTGEEYVARDLDPGVYYWRVAPADYQTREFQRPVRLEVGISQPMRTPITSRTPIIGRCSCEPEPQISLRSGRF